MKNYMKIMREMLKRRQFIFGKQNTNRHQPYVDDVVTSVYTQYNNASNMSDGGSSIPEAIMKFAPTKKEVIDIMKNSASGTVVFDISEGDVEFVDTCLYNYGDFDYIGYIYKLTKGSVTLKGNSVDLSGKRIICAGPVLTSDGKIAYVTTRPSDASADFDYVNNVLGHDGTLFDHSIPKYRLKGVSIVADFDPSNTDISITQLPDPPSYIVNITTDVLPYIIDHIYFQLVSGGDLN